MNDDAMKLAEEAIRIGASLLAQRDALAKRVAELESLNTFLTNESFAARKERDEYRRAMDDAQQKYENAMKEASK